ncbi:MAG: MerC domain-containing protein [Winogradskyella sp.]|nr:MAG: MerC domain-containing protein [Winogradskyella sp.]
MTTIKKIYWADKLGIVSAILCIIHCLATPLLMTIGVGFLNNPVIAILFILIAFVSIYKTTKRNFFKGVSILLWIAFTGFVISILLEEQSEIFEYGMYLFSTLIILGHFYNIRDCLKP